MNGGESSGENLANNLKKAEGGPGFDLKALQDKYKKEHGADSLNTATPPVEMPTSSVEPTVQLQRTEQIQVEKPNTTVDHPWTNEKQKVQTNLNYAELQAQQAAAEAAQKEADKTTLQKIGEKLKFWKGKSSS